MRRQGTLSYPPELRFTPSGRAVCTFQLTGFAVGIAGLGVYQCELWEPAAETFADLDLKEGDTVAVSGPLRTRTYRDRNGDTQARKVVSVRDYRFRRTDGSTA